MLQKIVMRVGKMNFFEHPCNSMISILVNRVVDVTVKTFLLGLLIASSSVILESVCKIQNDSKLYFIT